MYSRYILINKAKVPHYQAKVKKRINIQNQYGT